MEPKDDSWVGGAGTGGRGTGDTWDVWTTGYPHLEADPTAGSEKATVKIAGWLLRCRIGGEAGMFTEWLLGIH